MGVVCLCEYKQFSNGALFGNPLAILQNALEQHSTDSNKSCVLRIHLMDMCASIVLTKFFSGWVNGNTNFVYVISFHARNIFEMLFASRWQYIDQSNPNGRRPANQVLSSPLKAIQQLLYLTNADNTVKNGCNPNVTVKWYSDAAESNVLTGTNKLLM
jgi:hypothetical protein